jgi:transposase
VKEYVRAAKQRSKETFVPLTHPPGHAQVDFGQAIAVIGGIRQKIHVFFINLPHSDAPFMKSYPAETTKAFLDGHVSAFAFFDAGADCGQLRDFECQIRSGLPGRA